MSEQTSKKVILGVSGSATRSDLKPGDTTFWCVYYQSDGKEGNILLLYRKGIGISQIYKATGDAQIPGEFRCEERRMLTIPIELTFNLENPITAKDLKADPILRNAGFVRKNFQGTTFSVKPDNWPELIRIISEKNPQLTDKLETPNGN